MLEDCGPARGGPYRSARPGGATGTNRHCEPCDRPGSGPPVARGGPVTRAPPCSRALTKQPKTQNRKTNLSQKTDRTTKWSKPGAAVGCDQREYPLPRAQPSEARQAHTHRHFLEMWKTMWKTLHKYQKSCKIDSVPAEKRPKKGGIHHVLSKPQMDEPRIHGCG